MKQIAGLQIWADDLGNLFDKHDQPIRQLVSHKSKYRSIFVPEMCASIMHLKKVIHQFMFLFSTTTFDTFWPSCFVFERRIHNLYLNQLLPCLAKGY